LNKERIGEFINNTAVMLDMDEAFERLREIRRNGLPHGISTGWAQLDKYFTFPPTGQLNLVTGAPGSGKSEWLDSLCLNMIQNLNWKIFVYNPENFPADFYLQKMVEKYLDKPMFGHYNGYETINDDDFESAYFGMKDNICTVDCHINNASVDSILNAIFMECMEKKVNMAVIDPWNKLESQKDKGMNNTEFIGQALTRIQMFSRQNNISFWIVAHPSKPLKLKNGGFSTVTLYDVNDSANWYNMIDNGFIFHRNWEDKVGTGNIVDCKIAKIKDRRYGKCGECKFKFFPASGRYEAVDPTDGGPSVSSVGKW